MEIKREMNLKKKVPVVLLYFLVFSFYVFPKFITVEQRKPFEKQHHEEEKKNHF